MADNPVQGQQTATSTGSQFNAIDFICRQIVGRLNTTTLVQVKAVTNSGGVSPVGTVDVQPLVAQIDGAGQPTAHGTIFGLPYLRLQGGANAIILDPQVGDIGIAVFASTDISSVKATKKTSNPGSRRRFDMADGLYLGGVLNGTPTQYVRFSADGIAITATAKVTVTDGAGSTVVMSSNKKITLTDAGGGIVAMNGDGTGTTTFSGGLTQNGNLIVNGSLSFNGGMTGSGGAGGVVAALTGAVTATGEGTFNGGHTVSAHTHTQGADSHGDTEQPTNAPTG